MCSTRPTLSLIEVSVIEAEPMEILAIVVLGISAFVSFSTSDRKSKAQIDPRSEEDPDWAFTQAYEADGSHSQE
jgi:hypothetical protein